MLSCSRIPLLTVLLIALTTSLPAQVTTTDASDQRQLQAAYDRLVKDGISYLQTKGQLPDGSFHQQADPGVTALVTTALLKHQVAPDNETVAKSLAYLETYVRPDGGIYREGSFYRNYETSLCMMCFAEANGDGRYNETLQKAKKFVMGLQWDEGEGIQTTDVEYGGAGYGKHKRPDLSNTQFMIDALRAAGEDENSAAIQRALAFVSRCQNLPSEHNQTEFPKRNPDGGFYYTPASGGVSQAGEHVSEEGVVGGLRSYGSMTYAGLKSMIYAGVDKTDPRVVAAMQWIGKNYDLSENPGMGPSGLFYYYHTFAKALHATDTKLVDTDGESHDWRADLIRELDNRQRDDGAWVNANDRWLEGDANLVTGYSLLALAYARPDGE